MKNIEDITNFTIAEIAFFLLFIILIGYAVLADESAGPVPEPPVGKEVLEEKEKRILEQNELISGLKEELKKCQDKDKNLRSRVEPSCYETGFYKDYLFTAIILDGDTYRIGDEDYSWAGINVRFKPDIIAAKTKGCRHRIKVSFVSNITADDFDEALKKLELEFYTLRFKAPNQ